MAESGIHHIGPDAAAPNQDAVADIVFVHGLTGDPVDSWTDAKGNFWPSWIAEDFPTTNVYSISYNTKALADPAKGAGASLIDLGAMMLDVIASECGGKRPIVFVSHSLGGLVVKQVIRKSDGASNAKKKSIAPLTRGVFFIATPHQGAKLAKVLQSIGSFASSDIGKDLALGGDGLLDLGDWFRSWAQAGDVDIAAYYELKKYKGSVIVDQFTANPNVHGCDPVAINEDHVSIVKLADRKCQLYSSISATLKDILAKLPVAGTTEAQGWLGETQAEFEALTAQAEADRRSLAQKLEDSGRAREIGRAEAMKERFSMELHRHIAQPSAVARYTQLLSDVEGRFHRHVAPALMEKKEHSEINHVIQKEVIDPIVASSTAGQSPATPGQVESAIYYLAGNCHVDRDDG